MRQARSARTTRTGPPKSEPGAVHLDSLTEPPPPEGARDWNPEGVVIRKGMVPDYMIRPYEEVWRTENKDRPGGWPDCTPYMRHRELLDLCCFTGITEQIRSLLGEFAGVHLNLSGWQSTTRDWHQDTYLNPPHVGDYYCAVWIALNDIQPDSGPFQYVPGSHRWPVVTRDRILAALEPHERDDMWPSHSERILTPLFSAEIQRRNAEVVTYLPKKGDVLFWHGRLLHRGTVPMKQPFPERRALIAHYSGIHHRQDMPDARRHLVSSAIDGWYFPLTGLSNVGR